jgi:predicted RNA polymerase sigma factor
MTTDASPEVRAAVSAACTAERGRVVATLIAVTGDRDLAEECAQEAFTRALQAWQRDGVPARPGARLDRAVAVGMAQGPGAGLALLDLLSASGTLSGYHLLPAARADLLRRLGRHRDAAQAYAEALDLADTEAERRCLNRRHAETTAIRP